MARKRRICPPGVTFHLCNRTAGSLPLFQTPFDYLQWGQVLREALEKFPVSLFAYCVMPNHWHLLAQPQKPKSISRFMHWIGTTHAARYRKSHATVGHGAVYQNRFRSHAVEGPQAFLKTAAYIERNALSAGLVSKASAWPWSSAAKSTGLRLDRWPYPKPQNWNQLLAVPIDEETTQTIRWAEVSAQTFQCVDWKIKEPNYAPN